MLRLSGAIILVAVVAGAAARAVTQANRPIPQTSTFSALSDGVQNVFVEIVYTGPSNKPFPAVDLYSDGDPKEGFASLQDYFSESLPPIGNHMLHKVTAEQLKTVLNTAGQYKTDVVKPEEAVVGIFALQPFQKRSAATIMTSKSGRDSLLKLNGIFNIQSPTSASLQRLNRMIFTTAGTSGRD